MIYKRDGLLLPESKQKQIDCEMFADYETARQGALETYQDLTPTDEQKKIAIKSWPLGKNADLSANPDNIESYIDRKARLLAYKKTFIEDSELNSDVKKLYRWKTNEDLANLNMLIASASGDRHAFRHWNEFIYGKPHEDIYKAALDWIAYDAEKLVESTSRHPNTISAANEVLKLLKNKRGDRSHLMPDEETFERVRVDHVRPMGYYGLLLAGANIPVGKITNAEGDQILSYIIKNNLQCDYDIKDASGDSWGVSHSKKAIERPKAYNLPVERFIGLGAGHEIGSHLLEKENGMRGPLELASVGLDRYEAGNEGRAVIREEVAYETFDEFGKLVRWRDILRRHVAISYASGIGESSSRSSAEVYAFMNAIDTMYQSKLTPEEPEITEEKAAKKTSSLLLRVLKGTDGKGGAYLKDKVYLEGLVASWFTAKKKGATAISEGDLGKFDINNPRHINALQDLGLLPRNE